MLQSNKGMTIVEVMAAFAVLLLAAGSFLLCVQAANRQMDKALATRAQASALSEALAEAPAAGASGTEATYVFTYWTLPITVKVRGVEVPYGQEGAVARAFAPAEEAAP